MAKHGVLKKFFVLLMVMCMTASYMPTFAFAAEESSAEDPAITTVVSVKGSSSENTITVSGEKVTKNAELEGDSLTVKYAVSDDSDLQITVKNAEVKSAKNLQKSGSSYTATAANGSFELFASKGAKLSADFTEAEKPAEEEKAEAGDKKSEETASSDDEESDPAKGAEEVKKTEEPANTESEKPVETTANDSKDTKAEAAEKTEKADAAEKTEVADADEKAATADEKTETAEKKLTPTEELMSPNEGPAPGSGNKLLSGLRLFAADKTYEVGDKVSYTSTDVGQAAVFSVDGNDGCCAQAGFRHNSGTAPIDAKISNTSLTAKVVYYTAIQKNWTRNSNTGGSTTNGATYSIFALRMVQVAYQGKSAVWRELPDVSDAMKEKVEDAVEGCRNVTVPDNFEIYHVNVSGNNQSFLFWRMGPETGHLTLKKSAASTTNNYTSIAPANYTLQGATYGIYTNAACTTAAKDANGKTITLTTKADGSTDVVEVEPGTYYAKELTASKGFKVDTEPSRVTVTTANKKSNPATFTSTEQPVYNFPSVVLEKIDKTGNSGWKKLLGAQYTLRYYAVDPNTAVSNLPATPTKSWTFATIEKTDSAGKSFAGIDLAKDTPVSGNDFYMEGGKRVLPIGVFTVQETKAPKLFSKDETVYAGKVYQPSNGADAAVTQNLPINRVMEDDEQHAVIRVNKLDKETGEAMAQGTAREKTQGSLAGAEYDVYFDTPEEEEPVKVGTIVTDENGFGELAKDTNNNYLRLGHYQVVESKASPGYGLDKEKHLVVVRAQDNDSDFAYAVTESREPVRHTYVSKKVITTGEELPGATMQVLNSAGEVVEEWTSTNEPHDIVALHDETQGELKDGKYTLREITAPYGYDTAEDVEFEVKSGEVESTVEMKNAPITIRTNASDAETETRTGTFSKEEKIIDKVSFENLYAGREYTFKGTLMDKDTEQPLKDKEGNDITAEKTCTFDENGNILDGEYTGPKGVLVSGSVDIEFTVDASEFTKEKIVVATEKLLREDHELAMHADLNDEPQTIHYGGIVKTVAVDKNSKSHNLLADKDVTIVDTVEYKNLVVGETYTIKGVLYDKTLGSKTVITGEKTFKAEKNDGTVDVEFRFNASGSKNHDFVVFETLYSNDVEIDKHEDPEDEDQTVHVPEVRTTATDVKTGDHIAYGGETVQIKDVVLYSNLIPGKEYEMSGTLMNKKTGKPVMSNGAAVTATKKFTPSAKDGSVELVFTFNGVDLRGETVVAYEECKTNGVPVAVHADLNDKDQSVNIPDIGTEANLAKANKAVFDLVSYENLKPGKYIMRGWLMDKKTGKMVEDSEGETEFDVPEGGPYSGAVTVDLPIKNYGKLGGHKLVAFEELYYIAPGPNGDEETEVIVADHKDLDDGDQTVTIPGGKPKTGDDATLLLFGGVFGLSAALYLVLRKRQQMQDR